MTAVLYTIGYEGAEPGDLIATLHIAGVRYLLDVRAAPVSRRRAFSKANLAETLATAGVTYLHLAGLGNPKAGRDAPRTGDHERYRMIFLQQLESTDGQNDLVHAAELVQREPSCLICYERDEKSCHRLIVTDRLAAMTGQTVQHLRVKAGLAAEQASTPELFIPQAPESH